MPRRVALNGGVFACGNTEERLKHKVLGARKRGLPSLDAYDHAKGTGYVPYHRGDYSGAAGKSKVCLLVHEAGFGGMSPYAARKLRRLGRAAVALGHDATDYGRSYTARSFVPYYAQRLSWACAGGGAQAIHNSLNKEVSAAVSFAARALASHAREAPARGADVPPTPE